MILGKIGDSQNDGQGIMHQFFENPGLNHIGRRILGMLEYKQLLESTKVCKAWKNNIDLQFCLNLMKNHKTLAKYSKQWQQALAITINPDLRNLMKRMILKILLGNTRGVFNPIPIMLLSKEAKLLEHGIFTYQGQGKLVHEQCHENVNKVNQMVDNLSSRLNEYDSGPTKNLIKEVQTLKLQSCLMALKLKFLVELLEKSINKLKQQ